MSNGAMIAPGRSDVLVRLRTLMRLDLKNASCPSRSGGPALALRVIRLEGRDRTEKERGRGSLMRTTCPNIGPTSTQGAGALETHLEGQLIESAELGAPLVCGE